MADLAILRSRLLTRVPGRTSAELDGWINEASTYHGYSVTDVPAKAENAILAYAKYIGLEAKAEETAEDPALNLKGVGINKSGASGNYDSLIDRALREYRREATKAGLKVAVAGSITSGTAARADGR